MFLITELPCLLRRDLKIESTTGGLASYSLFSHSTTFDHENKAEWGNK
jgi:hypothetical protein